MLIDSNIIIYAARPEHAALRRFIVTHAPVVSAISFVEVLCYHQMSDDARQGFEAFFAAAKILPIDDAVLGQAVKLRQIQRMTLGDALVAATAIVYKHTLATHNKKDFEWIAGLSVLDPLSDISE